MDDAKPDQIRVERTFEFDLFGLTEILQGFYSRIGRLLKIQPKFNIFRENLCFPDPHIAWCCAWRGMRLASACDCVYVSCSPFSSAIAGYWICRITGKPLVLDFRDTWSINPHERPTRLRRFLTGKAEAMLIGAADWLIVNTHGAELAYKAKYPQFASKISAIPNGYTDRSELSVDVGNITSKYSIMYVGELYGRRSVDKLLNILLELNDIHISFVQIGSDGEVPPKYKNIPNVSFYPSVQHPEALALMRTASLLYLTQGIEEGVDHYVAVAQKTYEYLATGLPILADCPPGDNVDLVRKYAARSYVVTTGKEEDLKAALLQAIRDGPSAKPSVSAAFAETYSMRNLTQRLAEVLERVSS